METKDRNRRPRPASAESARGKPVRRRERKLKDSDVVYIPPKPFQRGRFFLRLVTVVAVVLALVLGMSIFFKVETVLVSGCSKYTPWDISQASGIEIGGNLLTVSRAQVSGNIISKLPYVDTVRVGIILPDTVNIEITELEIVYSVEDANGGWWLINEDGKVIESVNSVTAKSYTSVLGVRLTEPVVGLQAVAAEEALPQIPLDTPAEGETEGETTEPVETESLAEGETITVGITADERLQTALAVLHQLSANSITGQVDSVDVTDPAAIELWYEERFQVALGDMSSLEYKIAALKATVNKMESYESGQLDLSFTNWPDKVGYTPFE